jgi:hypothetical protein
MGAPLSTSAAGFTMRVMSPPQQQTRTAPRVKRTSIERLEHFVRTADRLENEHDFSALSVQLTIKVDEHGVSTSLDEPARDNLKALILDTRPFLLPKDDTYLPTIFADCRELLADPAAKRAIEDAARSFDQVGRRSGFQLVVNGESVSPAEAADLYLYGRIFHSDPEKERRLTGLDGLAGALVRDAFLWYLFRVAEIAAWTASVIRHERDARRLTGAEPIAPTPSPGGSRDSGVDHPGRTSSEAGR